MDVLDDHEENGIVTFGLTGTLDLYNSPEVKGRFNDWYEKGFKKFLIDLSGLDHVDSSGLAAFINLHSFLQEREGRSVLFGARGGVKRILELTDLNQRIFIVGHRDQALRILEKLKPV